MNSIILKARAKINLTLGVTGKRDNGYHELEMIMQTINLHDTIYIRKATVPGIKLSINYSWLPKDERNIAYKAAKLFLDEMNINEGLSMEIFKRIPVCAGLAGGSADAAAVLIGLNRIFNTHLSKEKLMEMGLKLGADVPFCIARGTMLATGIGEILTPLVSMKQTYVVIVKPPINISTPTVYGNLDINNIKTIPDTQKVIKALEEGNVSEIAANMKNTLEDVTIKLHPEIGKIKELFIDYGALGSMMSGSGSAVFGLFETKNKAEEVARKLKLEHNMREVFVTTTFTNYREY